MRRLIPIVLLCGAFAVHVSVERPGTDSPIPFAGLRAAAQITRDSKGIAHVQAANRHDLYLLQGYVHAQDRFFQMDLSRRQASGTLAELLGQSALATDVEFRTIGIRRAAERSFGALSPRARAALTAYADGVNSFLRSNPLPPEYGALELTHAEPWTALDSAAVAKLLAFGLSFDLSDIDLTVTLASYEIGGSAAGFDGRKLFFDDLFRSAPFDTAATIPDSSTPLMRPSGVLGSPFYLNLLPAWLTNEAYPLLDAERDQQGEILSVTQFVPARH
jgi:penicillin amidase